MPVDPGVGERLASEVSELYAAAQLRLLQRIARGLVVDDDGAGPNGWLTSRLAELDELRRGAARDLRTLDQAVASQVPLVIRKAYGSGAALAASDVGASGRDLPVVPQRARAMERLAAELLGSLGPLSGRILRSTVDLYQRAAARAAAETLVGGMTRRDATQNIVTEMAGKGITSYTDKLGRQWGMDTYAEMATRTATGRASVDGHVDQLRALTVRLVQVSDVPRECPACRPYEGAILDLGGDNRDRSEMLEPYVAGGRRQRVRIMGDLATARAKGFQHPNCRHSIRAYLPGMTPTPKPESDPEGYQAQQQQRAIERRIRKAKMEEATAVTPEAQRAARAKVRAGQQAMRDHLGANPELKRQSAREQLVLPETADKRPALRPLKAKPVAPKIGPADTRVAGKLPGQPQSINDALWDANPRYREHQDFQVNCQRAVVAYELRRRGYDVQARRPGPGTLEALTENWRDPQDIAKPVKWSRIDLRDVTSRLGNSVPGSRWQVTVAWRAGGAHVFMAEVGTDGTVRYVDPQTNSNDVARYLDQANPKVGAYVLRTDNMDITEVGKAAVK